MHFYERQFSPDYDRASSPPVEKTLVIASTPRCGSHMLGHSMIATGAMGFPFEYCNPTNLRKWKSVLGSTDFADTLVKVKERRTSSNGVFAVKVHFDHIKAFGTFEAMLEALPNPYFVVLERQELLAQAVSYARARQTGVWIDGQKSNGREATYDFALIDACLRKLCLDRAGWTFYLEQFGCRSLHLTYEAAREDMRGTLERIAGFAGIAIDGDAVPAEPVTRRQSGGPARQEDWVARYRADLSTAKPKPFRSAA